MSALNTQTGALPTTNNGTLSPELAAIANNPHAMAQLSQMLQAHNAAPVGLAPPIGGPAQAPASGWAAPPQPAAAGPWAQQQPQGQWGAPPPQQAPMGAMPPAQGVLISITVVLPNGLEMPISLVFDASIANNPQAIINVAMALGNAGAAVKAYPPRQQNGGGGGYGNRYGGGGGGGYNGGGGGYGGGGGGGGRWWGGRR